MGLLESSKVAFVFPGQGSQEIGMGQDFAEGYDCAQEIFRRADDVLGFSLSSMCFNGPDEDLKQTINTQPALYTASAAAFEVMKETGHEAAVTAGHSVGEYAALYAAGAFSFEEGLKLVRARAELMQKAASDNPGTMAAILGLSPEQVMQAVEQASSAGIVTAANFNSPIQVVISGEAEAVARACEIASTMGAKRVIPLNVSGGFHSPLMRGAADDLAEILSDAAIDDPSIPVVANYTARLQHSASDVRINLARQITGSVRWVGSVVAMIDTGVTTFVELGPGNVIGGLIKRIAPGAAVFSVSDKGSMNAALGA